jgi:ATP-dependent DNA helicase RecQ
MPTGSGKSLIYQLAAMMLPGSTLVISPLVALMKDQADSLTRRGLPATFINSSLDGTEQARRLRGVAAGEHKIVLVAPERLRSRPFRLAVGRTPISLLVVDEAHCVSQWGHDFRPDYLHVAEARRELRVPTTLALTATATERVQGDVIRLLGLPSAARLVTGFNRPNLSFEVMPAPNTETKLKLLGELLRAAPPGAGGIIYTGTRRDAEAVAAHVTDTLGVPTRYYHGQLEAAARSEVQDAFLAGDLPVVAATNAFGLGIDRPDVRFVIHYALPGSLEAYYQEAGRAGRDGLPARAVLLYAPRDTVVHQHFIEEDSPTAEELRAVHAALSAPGAADGMAREALARETGLTPVKLRVGLEQLEAAGALQRLPDEGFDLMRVETKPLPEQALTALARQVAARRQHKRRQLDLMVGYADTEACRRETLLRHFGDDGPAEAEGDFCCDNCAQAAAPEAVLPSDGRKAETRAERAALIVLDTIRHLPWAVGKGKLAQVLKGHASLAETDYARARNFGKLAPLTLKSIEGLIGEMTTARYLKTTGGSRPVLALTAVGERALDGRLALPVGTALGEAANGARSARPAAPRMAAGTTVTLSGDMLAQGRRPEEIAAERGLAVGTIYSHLAQLIAEGKVDVNAVVPAAVQAQVRAAAAAEGSLERLAPLKARLPAELGYDVIRCVVEAMRREQA